MSQIEITNTEVLSNNWYTLKKITYRNIKPDGSVTVLSREAYDRGNGATILLYHKDTRNIILTRQFRMPTYLNGNSTGFLIECCAGLLDKDDAEACIMRETEEETGYKVTSINKVFEAYMSPGSVTELLYFFVAEYEPSMKVSEGGGLEEESENIEVLELPFDDAVQMIKTGEIKDAKTIMLLQYAQISQLFG